jgi:hypothetical protein
MPKGKGGKNPDMYRFFSVLCVISLVFFAACSKPAPQPQPEQPAQQGEQAEQPATPPAQEVSPEIQEIQQMLRDRDYETAITRLEGMYAQEPTARVTNLLIQAHGAYAIMVSEMSGVDETDANRVLYMHLMRVNELDPNNQEARQGLEQVKAWYDNHNMPLPEQVEPLAFLPPSEETVLEEQPPDGSAQ